MSENQSGATAGVDVVIPCYQYGRFLRDCVRSVLTQGIGDIRVLIIDNASTDDSVEVAQQLAAEDPRVELVARPRNLGPHASFNEGIDWAKATYFMVLCADDLLAPDALARVVPVMERHPDVGFAYGRAASLLPGEPMPVLDASLWNAPWQIVAGQDLIERFCGDGVNHVPGPSTVVVRTAVQKLGGLLSHRAAAHRRFRDVDASGAPGTGGQDGGGPGDPALPRLGEVGCRPPGPERTLPSAAGHALARRSGVRELLRA